MCPLWCTFSMQNSLMCRNKLSGSHFDGETEHCPRTCFNLEQVSSQPRWCPIQTWTSVELDRVFNPFPSISGDTEAIEITVQTEPKGKEMRYSFPAALPIWIRAPMANSYCLMMKIHERAHMQKSHTMHSGQHVP